MLGAYGYFELHRTYTFDICCFYQLKYIYILKDVLPFIYVFIDDDIVVNMEHSITLFNNTYALLEIIYFGNFHYTSHVVDKNRGIWFYDGIKTCGSWATKWQNTIPECFLLLHYLSWTAVNTTLGILMGFNKSVAQRRACTTSKLIQTS